MTALQGTGWCPWGASVRGKGFTEDPWAIKPDLDPGGQLGDQYSKQTQILSNTIYFVERGSDVLEFKEKCVCSYSVAENVVFLNYQKA